MTDVEARVYCTLDKGKHSDITNRVSAVSGWFARVAPSVTCLLIDIGNWFACSTPNFHDPALEKDPQVNVSARRRDCAARFPGFALTPCRVCLPLFWRRVRRRRLAGFFSAAAATTYGGRVIVLSILVRLLLTPKLRKAFLVNMLSRPQQELD